MVCVLLLDFLILCWSKNPRTLREVDTRGNKVGRFRMSGYFRNQFSVLGVLRKELVRPGRGGGG